jgi:phosphate/sulfate permease
MVEEGFVGTVIVAIVVALLFDFVNGSHNSTRANVGDCYYRIIGRG